MSYQYNYSCQNESQSAEFRLSLYIKVLTDFIIPNYSISVIPSIVEQKPNGSAITYSLNLTDTTFTPLPNLFDALRFFRTKVYQKFIQECENKILTSKLEKFGFNVDDLGIDISTNFLDESAINKIVADLVPESDS
ncbi:MAG TPA: hypothetical protein V6C58_08995 [Allocoleopsis sp.]